MKKLLCVLFVSMILFLCGCEKSNTPDTQPLDLYAFKNGDMVISLGSEFSREKYGQELEYSEIPSCAFEGLDKTYRYSHYEITTVPAENKDIIYSIYFLDAEVTTKEGIRISDTLEKLLEVYGKNYEQKSGKYVYTKGNTSIEFLVENDIILSIEYVFLID